MPYSQFTIDKAKRDLKLTIVEGVKFFPDTIAPITLTPRLETILEDLPWAVAVGTEKARSEVIINPVLLEMRRILNREISVFSGEQFDVDIDAGLNGVCDFLVSRSKEQLTVEAPTIVVVEAKKADLKLGLGQCIAEMVAMQRFNEACGQPILVVYGCVTSGTQWRFLKLESQVVTIDLNDYPLPPIEQILGFLVWMVKEG
ncbi:MAG: hypothetical protein DSM106950_26490 [Stigonema ocellatum SAG 48.90 = DSM 106950]|nr:hypothetical protein [Stigonema ocellatum SAG 48.90 = DSM 106950]